MIGGDRERTKVMVELDAPPQIGDHLEISDSGSLIVHHFTASKRQDHDGIIVAGLA